MKTHRDLDAWKLAVNLAELETLIIIASNARFLDLEAKQTLLESRNRAAQTLQGLIRSLKS